ncbi:hypothetical protein EVAR_81859_1 [Eumeta japonica]|uniref:Uncharacterized protein n=1 Tax=Eumeta variegata TaxID=151549 RepID=A0A4C1ZUY0_EUMVA|nr:hypothetical protein EVAR_81859_1 [Eumeta japonica]
MFVQDKDRWTELRRRCADKGIQFSQARNSVQGLKLQAKPSQILKSAKLGVPKEIPVDEVRKTSLPKAFRFSRCAEYRTDSENPRLSFGLRHSRG